VGPELNLFDDPRARKTDPETSHLAAKRAGRNAYTARVVVLRLLVEHGPLTDQGMEQLAKQRKYPVSPSGLRSRRVELKRKGLVRSTGRYAEILSGGKAEVWEITAAGVREYHEAMRDLQ